jgi:Tol biopolymer transport system component
MLLYDSAVGGNSDIYLMRVGGERSINLTEDSEVYDGRAAFAPDGENIAFRSEREGGGLFVMGATGESVRRATDRGFDPEWSPDGLHLAFASRPANDPYARSSPSEMWRVDLRDGSTTRLTETDAVQPAWSPDGGRIAFWANIGGQRDIWTIDADGGEPLAVTSDRFTDWSPAWSPDGRWLYFSSDRGGSMNLWRVPIEAASGRTRGEPQRVTSGMRDVGHAGLAADGSRMVLMAYERSTLLVFQDIDPSEPCSVRTTRVLGDQSPSWCSLSPDGQWLACTIRGAQEDIVVLRRDGSDVRRLTDDPAKDRAPVWMPDGESVTFSSTRSGTWEIWTIRTDGSPPRQLTEFGEAAGSVVSPDGRRMMVNADYVGQLWLVTTDRLNTPRDAKRIDVGAPRFVPDAWSPEGDRVAGTVTGEDGRPFGYGIYDVGSETYLSLEQQAPGPSHEAQVAGWLPDSRRLVLVSGSDVVVYDTATGESCTLLPADPKERYRLDANGTVLLVERDRLDSAIWELTFEEE